MKKIFTLVISALLFAGGLQAQQFSGDFSAWQDCIPDGQTQVAGKEPVGWSASNVVQFFPFGKLVRDTLDRKEDVAGHSVLMMNRYCGALGIGSTAPGFITLGNTWVYADVAGLMHDQTAAALEKTYGPDWRNKREEMSEDDKSSFDNLMEMEESGATADMSDGGSFGGVAFTHRPDSIVGYIKREHGEEDNPEGVGAPNKDEIAKIIAYSWTGTTKSSVKQGLDFGGMVEASDIIDRDKDVLGMITEGVTGDATLIASADKSIEGNLTEWTYVSVPLVYKGEGNPEKINVVLSASDYYNRKNLGAGNTLWADDFRFIYNTKLKSITLGGQPLEGFEEDVYTYQFPYDALGSKEIAATAWGNSGTTTVDIQTSTEANVVTKTIKVSDANSAEAKERIYTIIFKGAATTITTPEEAPAVTYGDIPTGFGFTSNNTAPFTYKFSKDGIIKQDAETKQLTAIGVGTVEVTACQAGNDDYADGVSATPLTVTVSPATIIVSLAEGAYCERGNNVSASNLKNKTCGYTLIYDGLKNDDTDAVFTKAVTVTSKAATEAETVGAKRAVTLSDATADNYTFTYAENQQLTITKTHVNVYVTYAGKNIHGDYDSQHKLSIPAGLAKHPLSLAYTGFVYKENESVLGTDNLPVITCDVKADTPVGTEVPVTISLPQDTENYIFVNKIPTDGAVVIKKAPLVTITKEYNKVYGDPVSALQATATKDDGETAIGFSVINKNMSIAYVKSNTTDLYVVAAGDATIILRTKEDDEYAMVEDTVKVHVAQAPITAKVTPATATCKVGEALPTFAVELPNLDAELKNEDKREDVIITEPTVDLEGITTTVPGTFTISVIGGELNPNYELKSESATLTVEKENSIDNVNAQSLITAYPNPAIDIIRVIGAEVGNAYNISNIAGSIVKAGEINAEINVSDLSSGIYFLQVNGQTLKFVKK